MKKKGLLRNVISFSTGVGLSRLTGLLREMIFAMFFGASSYMDAFRVAYNVPNILRDLVAEGSLSAVVVPSLVSKEKEGKEKFFELFDRVISSVLIYVTILSIAMIILSPVIMRIVVPGFLSDPDKFNLVVSLSRIIFPFLIIVSLATVLSGFLNIYKHFFASGFATVLFNTGIILSVVILYPILKKAGISPIYSAAIGVIVGGILQLLVYVPFLLKHGYVYKFRNPFHPEVNSMIISMLPVMGGIAAGRINVVVNTYIASFLVVGSISYLSYAFRLMTLPLGVFGVSVSTVALPDMSREEGYATFVRGMKINFAFTIPVAFLLYFLSVPVVGIIYQHGVFSYTDTLNTASVLKLYAIGIPFLSVVKLISSLFYSRKDTKTPALITLGAVIVNILVALSLVKMISYRALAVSLVSSSFFNASLLWFFATKKFGFKFNVDLLKEMVLWIILSFVIVLPSLIGNRIFMGSTFKVYILQLICGIISTIIWLAFIVIRRRYGRTI